MEVVCVGMKVVAQSHACIDPALFEIRAKKEPGKWNGCAFGVSKHVTV